MSEKITDTNFLANNQYRTSDNLHSRWALYNFCVPSTDVYGEALGSLNLSGNEDILEVGCGDGGVLTGLIRNGHAGRLVGVDMQPSIEDQGRQRSANSQVEFVVGDTQRLPFADNSFDTILAFFMLYHVRDIARALGEWRRVLRPGGKVLVATSSVTHRSHGTELERILARLSHSKAHPQFSETFNLENARAQLEPFFDVLHLFDYQGEIRIGDPEVYMQSLDSSRDLYEPIPTDEAWTNARKNVKKLIDREIARDAYFADPVWRGWFICQGRG